MRLRHVLLPALVLAACGSTTQNGDHQPVEAHGGAAGEATGPSAGAGNSAANAGGQSSEAGAPGATQPDACADVTCDNPPAASCKDAQTSTSYAATGKCNGGICSYATTDTDCASNQQCGGAGVCILCNTDAACGASCTACASGKKCKDLGTTSKCVGCLSNADCAGSTPICDLKTNLCEVQPSSNGLAKTCGPDGTADCAAANLVAGGTVNRGNDPNYPAVVANFRLDNYEITVGRFRKFVAAYSQTMIAAGAGKNPHNAVDRGWEAAWNASLPATAAALAAALKCDATHQTWTDAAGTAAAESLPITCLSWYEAEAFCMWDGGRLPTEAEWNYAAAGGPSQRLYPWGGGAVDCSYANFHETDYCVAPGTGGVNRVGSESPKGDGLYGQSDLSGNLWEWTQDSYVTPYANICDNCAVTDTSPERVTRGGGFDANGSALTTISRGVLTPSLHYYTLGARCARNP